jgi:undecaprenyl pyrophosphate phosphatase UppP
MIVLVGGSLGLAQWLVLRRCVHHAAWWILVNVLSWGIVGLVIGGTVSSLLDPLAFVLIPAIAISVVLWLLLDRLPHHKDNGRNMPLNPV